MKRRFLLPFLFLLLSACEGVTVSFLSFSTWGGAHMVLIITFSGANVEYDCARGEIVQPIQPVDGRFSVKGFHWAGTGGPIGVDTTQPPRPARFDGIVKDDRMTLTVTLTDKNERLGTFDLRGGASPSVFKCL
jgi:hypothetical protein